MQLDDKKAKLLKDVYEDNFDDHQGDMFVPFEDVVKNDDITKVAEMSEIVVNDEHEEIEEPIRQVIPKREKKEIDWKIVEIAILKIGKMAMAASATFAIVFVLINMQSYLERANYWWDEVTFSEAKEVQQIMQANIMAEIMKMDKEIVAQAETLGNFAPREELLAGEVPEIGYVPDSYALRKAEDLMIDINPSDDRIVIPRIKKNIPIVWAEEGGESDIMTALESGVAHFPGTAYPGEVGNAFFTGHSSYYAWASGRYKSVFALLDKVQMDDEVDIYYGGEKFVYKIYDSIIVKPENLSVLDQPMDGKEISIMTCTPVGTNKNRLIMRGRLLEE